MQAAASHGTYILLPYNLIRPSSCSPKSVSVKSARSVETDAAEEEVPDEYVTETSPTFLLAIFCWLWPAAASRAYVWGRFFPFP